MQLAAKPISRSMYRVSSTSEQEMEIRFLTPDDAAEYWRLRLEALQRDPEAFGSSAEEHQSLSLEEVGARPVLARESSLSRVPSTTDVCWGRLAFIARWVLRRATRGECGAFTSRRRNAAQDWDAGPWKQS